MHLKEDKSLIVLRRCSFNRLLRNKIHLNASGTGSNTKCTNSTIRQKIDLNK